MNKDALQTLQRKTIRRLTTGQILSGFGLGSTLSIGALLAAQLSGSDSWSGAAATFSTLGAASWAIPLSRLAYAKGRRVSLAVGATIAITGALLVITAASIKLFPLLLVALFCLGAGSATGLQARFAANDLPSTRTAGRDLSVVVWATTIGAVIGPNMFGPGEVIGKFFHMPTYTGPFLLTIAAQLAASCVFFFGLKPDPLKTAQALEQAKGPRGKISLKSAFETLAAHPVAAYAMISVALSHMVMVSVMAMTPVHMKNEGADLVLVGLTISFHIAGMYAFSPVFGWLADKLGRIQIVIAGQVIYVAALILAGTAGMNNVQITAGLFLLGLGWSAATVAGSALLSTSLPADQKTNVQGVSDAAMQLSGAFGGAVSGSILLFFNFGGLNAAAMIPVSIVLALSGFALLRRRA